MRRLLTLLFLLAAVIAEGQTCTGGLGDPLVNITFGAGSNYGPALAAGITNMQYTGNACPEDGQYTIANGTTNCYSGSWFNVLHDHTGDYSGYFMLINASYQPSDFYVQTVSGLCEGTTYQFAAWLLNMVSKPNEILPSVTFQIEKADGTILGKAAGDVPQTASPLWKQYGFYFTTPPGVSAVVIRMTNNAPGGIGNDLALDDITFRPVGPKVNLQVAGSVSDTLSLCESDPAVLSLSSVVESCYATPTYQWQQSVAGVGGWTDIPGAVNPTYSRAATGAGTYLYRLKVAQAGNIGSAFCSVASSPVMVVVKPVPVPAVTISAVSTQVCAGAVVRFTAAPVNGGDQPVYQWQVNGVDAGTGDTSYSSSILADGDIVRCVMVSDALCVLAPTVVSNVLPISVIPDAVTAVSITASANRVCADSLVSFAALPENGGSDPSYQWTVNGRKVGVDSAGYSSADWRNGDIVNCVMTGSETCSLPVMSGNVSMTVYPLPEILLTPDTIIAAGSSIRLSPLISGNIRTYEWSPATWLDDPSSPGPLAAPVVSTLYALKVVTQDGCKASAGEDVHVFYDLLMPGAFTPNGDGNNDLFRVPPSVPVTIVRFFIYNRWGVRVFATTSSGGGWDGNWNGKPQPAGVYIWEIAYGDPILKKTMTKSGTVLLVR
ncbi:MAG TPA: gliding motility-associated C-terminal domain-containing protein [Puia sp.]|jgi:gliding motility-associated-like protein